MQFLLGCATCLANLNLSTCPLIADYKKSRKFCPMRCTVTFTCIAQCFAAYMWRRAGLLTKDDCALLASVGILPANDSGERYAPHDFERFTQKITCLVKPTRGDNPLQVNGHNTTAVGNYGEWREQLHKILRIYAEQAYKKDSFKRREGESTVDLIALINERPEEFKQVFSPSAQLRSSYEYLVLLMRSYDFAFGDFTEIPLAIDRIWRQLSKLGEDFKDKSLDSLEDATIMKLNTLRGELNQRSKFTSARGFNLYISDDILGTATNPKPVDDDIVKSYRDYCEKGLAYAHKVPPKLSNEITHNCIKRVCIEDIYKYAHYVYPELDYEGWGICWRAVQNQVTSELEALQKHVEEVSVCMSNLQEFIQLLADNFDSAMSGHNTIKYPDAIHVPGLINYIVANEIEVVVERTINQVHEKISENTNSNEAALAGEPGTTADEVEK
ncbi:hypothetical protein PAPHI01_2083 [Pancytospora philotis]|nr:hypothetical protein PAPHI01_2083 [Pancytospora philotis]